jgi:hypothetical protein
LRHPPPPASAPAPPKLIRTSRRSAPRKTQSVIASAFRVERRVQVVDPLERLAVELDEKVAALKACGIRGRAVLDRGGRGMPVASGNPTDRRSRRATCGGAIAMPSRRRVGRLAAAKAARSRRPARPRRRPR